MSEIRMNKVLHPSFYNLVRKTIRGRGMKKKRPCLKCGELYQGTTYNRICGSCQIQNDKFRSNVLRGNVIPLDRLKGTNEP